MRTNRMNLYLRIDFQIKMYQDIGALDKYHLNKARLWVKVVGVRVRVWGV